ncbi:MAG: glycosyltransferase family 2 protein [Polyangiaceae bacterium]|nr:glycosyltransferase family 2 protein [Polyangiaceae bacterium]
MCTAASRRLALSRVEKVPHSAPSADPSANPLAEPLAEPLADPQPPKADAASSLVAEAVFLDLSASNAPLATVQTGAALVKPRISIVVPALNESDSLPELAARIHTALDGNETYELIFVDDGSSDDSWKVMGSLSEANPRVRGVRLRKNFGKAMALTAGFSRARGDIVLMMDADLQDDPAELPKFIKAVDEGFDVVVGWKVKRHDPANRLVLTRIFNGTVRWVTGVKLHDMNCGFKAFSRDVITTVPIYADLFRFIPALAAWEGFKVTEVPVTHHARKHGTSRYGLERIVRGSFDLLSIAFLTKYSRRPMHFFGAIGVAMGAVGLVINLYLTALWFLGHKIGDRPLLLFGTMLMLLGLQFFSTGFIGEYLTYLHQKRLRLSDLPIRGEHRPQPIRRDDFENDDVL